MVVPNRYTSAHPFRDAMKRFPAAVLVAATALAACTRAPHLPPSSIVLDSCRLPGIEIAAQCGTLEVWEDREAKTGRKVKWQELGQEFEDHRFRFQVLDEGEYADRDWREELKRLLESATED